MNDGRSRNFCGHHLLAHVLLRCWNRRRSSPGDPQGKEEKEGGLEDHDRSVDKAVHRIGSRDWNDCLGGSSDFASARSTRPRKGHVLQREVDRATTSDQS